MTRTGKMLKKLEDIQKLDFLSFMRNCGNLMDVIYQAPIGTLSFWGSK